MLPIYASNIGYYRQITRNLGGESIWICVNIYTLDSQKRDIGIQHHRCLEYLIVYEHEPA
jgi:hypothetical protein